MDEQQYSQLMNHIDDIKAAIETEKQQILKLSQDIEALKKSENVMNTINTKPPVTKPIRPIPKQIQPVQPIPPTIQPQITLQKTESRTAAHSNKNINAENAVGKYLIGILASLLVFVGCSVFVMAIWNVIPDVVKAALIIFLGMIFLLIGWLMIHHKHKDPFSYSISACGLGTIYVGIIASNMVWNIIPFYGIALGIFVWIILCIYLANLCHSRLFIYILGVGNLVTSFLVSELLYSSLQDVVAIIFIMAVHVMAIWFYKKQYRKYSFFLSITTVLSELLLFISIYNMYQPDKSSFALYNQNIVFVLLIISIVEIIALSAFYPIVIDKTETVVKKIIVILILFTVYFLSLICMSCILKYILPKQYLNIITYISNLILLLPVLWNSKTRKMLLCLFTICVFYNLYELSYIWTDGFLFISLYAIVSLIFYIKERGKWLAAHTIITEGILLICFNVRLLLSNLPDYLRISTKLVPDIIIISTIVAYFSIILYRKYKKSIWSDMDMLMNIVSVIAIAFSVFSFSIALQDKNFFILPIALLYILLCIYIRTTKNRNNIIILFNMLIEICLEIAVFIWIDKNIRPVYLSIGVITLSAIGVIFLIDVLTNSNRLLNKKAPLIIIPALCCTANVLRITNLTSLGNYKIAVSFICLLTAVVFILIGFKLLRKELRLYGLILLIISVLKMVTWDITDGAMLIRVAALIAGGVLCFIISFVYNNFEKRNKKED